MIENAEANAPPSLHEGGAQPSDPHRPTNPSFLSAAKYGFASRLFLAMKLSSIRAFDEGGPAKLMRRRTSTESGNLPRKLSTNEWRGCPTPVL
jgi:hypothetical protein